MIAGLLALAALPPLALCLWLLVLTAASRRRPPPPPVEPRAKFCVLIPAHDEEQGIARTVGSVGAVDYPKPLVRIVVVADNCKDGTAQAAREAGAEVVERTDPDRRGKGHALAFGFAHALADPAVSAAVVVDADTLVSPNLLAAFAARLDSGAQAVQADYGVENRGSSWRTRLMHLALTLFHTLRSLGRENLGLSCGLRGNGMCFSRQVLAEVPEQAVGLVEDVEQGIALGERGIRVHYAAEASVLGEMVAGAKAARSQRDRWERGRAQLRRRAVSLLATALRRRNLMLFDLAMDLLVPPLATLTSICGAGTAATLVFARAPLPLLLWAIADACLCAYLARGLVLSGGGWRAVADLAAAPLYLGWKLTLALSRRTRGAEWVRTRREARRP